MDTFKEIKKMVDLTSENIYDVESLINVRDRLIEFKNKKKDLISDDMKEHLDIAMESLSQSIVVLNSYGKLLDGMFMELTRKLDKPRYYSVDADKRMIHAETQKSVLLVFPPDHEDRMKMVWHPKSYVGATQDGKGIIVRFYPDWHFEMADYDSHTGKRMEGSVPEKIDADQFLDMLAASAVFYGYGMDGRPLKPLKLNNGKTLK